MSTLTIILVTIVATIALCGVVFAVLNAKKANPGDDLKENFGKAWVKIRPILSDLFINLYNIYEADKGGYEELEKFAVTYVKNQIDNADFLGQTEKDLLSYEFLRSILAPQLRELYLRKAGL